MGGNGDSSLDTLQAVMRQSDKTTPAHAARLADVIISRIALWMALGRAPWADSRAIHEKLLFAFGGDDEHLARQEKVGVIADHVEILTMDQGPETGYPADVVGL